MPRLYTTLIFRQTSDNGIYISEGYSDIALSYTALVASFITASKIIWLLLSSSTMLHNFFLFYPCRVGERWMIRKKNKRAKKTITALKRLELLLLPNKV